MASFTTSAESLKARLHLSHIPTPLLAGCALLVFGVVAGVGVWLFGLSSTPAFSVETGSFDQGVSFGEAAQGENGAARAAAEVQENSEVGESGRKGVVAAADAAAEALAADKGHALVHVTGAVECPGVYRVAVGARVQDAVDAAGGVTGDAASDAVNMARPVADGEQVRVPTQEEVQANPAGVVQQAVEGGSAAASAAGASPAASGGLVNINTATEAELDTLPGIGPATAAAIVLEREEGGLFATPEDIMRVSGIGEKKFAKLNGAICV